MFFLSTALHSPGCRRVWVCRLGSWMRPALAMLGALLLHSGMAWGHEIPWHLGRVDGAQAAPSAINTAGNQPGPHPVVVAVIDSGVVASHPSLQGQLLPGYDMISPNRNLRKARSGNFSPDERDARCGERLLPSSFRSHGTEVASLIAGNGVGGVLGVNPAAKIVPVRLFGACATSRQDLLDAMAWAAGLPVKDVPDNPHPARIINLSLSGGFNTCGADLQGLSACRRKTFSWWQRSATCFKKRCKSPPIAKGSSRWGRSMRKIGLPPIRPWILAPWCMRPVAARPCRVQRIGPTTSSKWPVMRPISLGKTDHLPSTAVWAPATPHQLWRVSFPCGCHTSPKKPLPIF